MFKMQRLNELNYYMLYFPGENPKQLYQGEIIEILDVVWRIGFLFQEFRENGDDQTHQRSKSCFTTNRY
jgi:hypothetical protein